MSRTFLVSFSSLPIIPAILLPNAIMQAPVNVAISIIILGLYCLIPNANASASINLPSASVLITSTLFPLYILIMSLGLLEELEGIFSTAGIIPITLCFIFKADNDFMIAITLTPPHLSNFISSILSLGLIDIPPESNVTAFPTSKIGFSSFLVPSYFYTIILCVLILPPPTETIPFNLISFIDSKLIILDLIP